MDVLLHSSGDHTLSEPLELTAADSGEPDAPITYTAYDSASPPLVHGGVQLKAESFEPVTMADGKVEPLSD